MKIKYNQPNLTEEDIEAASNALRKPHIAGNGPLVLHYEHQIAEYTGADYAIAVANATVGLEIVYSFYFNRSYPVKTPSLSFAATATALQRARILLGDAKPQIEFVDPTTRFITETEDISVSYAGYPLGGTGFVADDAHYIYEDMCDFAGRYEARVLSHHAVKPLACGEGGTILTNDPALDVWARNYRSHFRVSTDLGTSGWVGSNYRMQEAQAAILMNRLPRLSSETETRQALARRYRKNLDGIVKLPPDHEKHSYHLFVLEFRDKAERDLVQTSLKMEGVESVVHYKPIPLLPAFINKHQGLWTRATQVWNTCLSIPVHHGLKFADIDFISDIIKGSVNSWRTG